MSKLYAIYTIINSEERFLGQAYLTKKDLESIEQSFLEQLNTECPITLTDGEVVDVSRIDSIEEIVTEKSE